MNITFKQVAAITDMQLLCSCHIAGAQPAGAKDIVRGLKPGDVLSLQREANNPYDPNAVQVLYSGRKIGFVPGASGNNENIPIAALLDAGKDLTVIVQETQAEGHIRVAVTLGIYIATPEAKS